jgi:glycosyltransferase involved in cell wall biosynthesis
VIILMALSSPWSRVIAERLTALGVELHVVDLQVRGSDASYLPLRPVSSGDSANNLESRVASVHRVLPPRPIIARLFHTVRALRRIARETRPDAVLTLYGGSLAATSYLSGVRPYVVYVVGSDVLLANWIQKRVAKVTLKSAAAVVANGRYLAARTLELVPTAKLTALYMGIDLDRFSFSAKPDCSPAFVCTRGFLSVYDNATIIRAFGKLNNIPSNLTVSFLSSGPLLAECVALADGVIAPAWRARMVFVGGVSDAAMNAVLESASYYVSASLSDGASSSLLEAMACGLFPIVSDIPANREWVVHEKNGLLFSPGDASHLSECIRRVLSAEPWMTSARISNRRLVEQHGNVDASMRALVDLLGSHRRNQVKL